MNSIDFTNLDSLMKLMNQLPEDYKPVVLEQTDMDGDWNKFYKILNYYPKFFIYHIKVTTPIFGPWNFMDDNKIDPVKFPWINDLRIAVGGEIKPRKKGEYHPDLEDGPPDFQPDIVITKQDFADAHKIVVLPKKGEK